MNKRFPITFALTTLLSIATVRAQPAPPLPAFEVASIKPSAPLDFAALRAGSAHIGTKIDAGRVDIGTASLFRLICTAYRARPYQVTGPDWLKSTSYDIRATIPAGATVDQVPEMLQTLLVERFGLKIRHDTKQQAVYALTVMPGGPKMKEAGPEAPAPPPPAGTPKPMEMSIPTIQGDVKLVRSAQGVNIEMMNGDIAGRLRVTVDETGGKGQPQSIHLESSGTSMKTLAEMLSVGVVDRPVVDATGVGGTYEVSLDISTEEAMNVVRATASLLPGGGGGPGEGRGGEAADPSGASVFKSLQKLGLKLEPRKLPLDALVIEHMERTPAAN